MLWVGWVWAYLLSLWYSSVERAVPNPCFHFMVQYYELPGIRTPELISTVQYIVKISARLKSYLQNRILFVRCIWNTIKNKEVKQQSLSRINTGSSPILVLVNDTMFKTQWNLCPMLIIGYSLKFKFK